MDSLLLSQECGKQNPIFRPRIYGGTEAVIGEYPWMVRMIHKNTYGQKSYGCAGFLIHPKYVVTAAHCIQSEFTDIRGQPYVYFFLILLIINQLKKIFSTTWRAQRYFKNRLFGWWY